MTVVTSRGGRGRGVSGGSSDVCSCGLGSAATVGVISLSGGTFTVKGTHTYTGDTIGGEREGTATGTVTINHDATTPDRKSGVEGKRVDLGGRRILKNEKGRQGAATATV